MLKINQWEKLALIARNIPDAYNQVWHLPTTKELLTARQWIELIADELGLKPKIQKMPTWMLSILGLFKSGHKRISGNNVSK